MSNGIKRHHRYGGIKEDADDGNLVFFTDHESDKAEAIAAAVAAKDAEIEQLRHHAEDLGFKLGAALADSSAPALTDEEILKVWDANMPQAFQTRADILRAARALLSRPIAEAGLLAASATPGGQDVRATVYAPLVDAAEEFVMKCENGSARSSKSYKRFKAALAAIAAIKELP